MAQNVKISFVVPIYNAAVYLAECLDSLLCQDLSPEEWEILCIDDGSTDDSSGILDQYACRHPQVRVVHKENGGVTTARNLGISLCRGEYLWFVDADDRVRENILGRVWQAISETGCQRLVLDAHTFTDLLSPQALSRPEDLPRNTPWQDAVVWRNLIQVSFLRDHGLTFAYPELTHGEDGLFMYEVAAAGPKTHHLPAMAYFYRIHSGSAETAVSLESRRKKLRSYLRLTQIMQNYYRQDRKDAATANKLMSFLWFSLYEAARLPKAEGDQVLSALQDMGLYPGKRLPECDLESAYLISGPGILGKLLDQICMNLQSPWAYRTLRLLLKLKGT